MSAICPECGWAAGSHAASCSRPAVPAGLEALLAQLEPPGVPDTVTDGLYEAAESMLAARRLERLAPDAVRLLIDMAECVAGIRDDFACDDPECPCSAGKIAALLARFATLNEKAGTA